jgi:hypothetical protein
LRTRPRFHTEGRDFFYPDMKQEASIFAETTHFLYSMSMPQTSSSGISLLNVSPRAVPKRRHGTFRAPLLHKVAESIAGSPVAAVIIIEKEASLSQLAVGILQPPGKDTIRSLIVTLYPHAEMRVTRPQAAHQLAPNPLTAGFGTITPLKPRRQAGLMPQMQAQVHNSIVHLLQSHNDIFPW